MTTPTLDVATPERVSVELPIAGIGFRAMAYLLDAGLLFATAVVGYFLFTLAVPDPVEAWMGISGTLRVIFAALVFFVLWTYWTVLEVVWHGQTIGKRLMRIRVVSADGSPVTALESAIRNLFRLLDFLPLCYPVGVVSMLIDRRHRRIGDIVAGTVLVREEKINLARYEQAGGAQSSGALTPQDVEVITGFLDRFDSLEGPARLALGRQLCARFGVPPAEAAALDETRLRSVLRAKLGGA